MSKKVACPEFRKCSHAVPRATYGHILHCVWLNPPRTLQANLRGRLRRISQQAPPYEPDVAENVVTSIVGNYSEPEVIHGGYLTSVSVGSEAMRTNGGDSKQRPSLTTNCTKDSPLTVYVPKIPIVAGCYPKVAERRNGTGIYDSSMRENPSIMEFVISAEEVDNGGSSGVSTDNCLVMVFPDLRFAFSTDVRGKKAEVQVCFELFGRVFIVLRSKEGKTYRTPRIFSI